MMTKLGHIDAPPRMQKLATDKTTGRVQLTIELTTPACPVKDMFKNQANEYVMVRRRVRATPRGTTDLCQ